jgi:hypothetical protein
MFQFENLTLILNIMKNMPGVYNIHINIKINDIINLKNEESYWCIWERPVCNIADIPRMNKLLPSLKGNVDINSVNFTKNMETIENLLNVIDDIKKLKIMANNNLNCEIIINKYSLDDKHEYIFSSINGSKFDITYSSEMKPDELSCLIKKCNGIILFNDEPKLVVKDHSSCTIQ